MSWPTDKLHYAMKLRCAECDAPMCPHASDAAEAKRELLTLVQELIAHVAMEDQGANQAARVIAAALDGEDWRAAAPRGVLAARNFVHGDTAYDHQQLQDAVAEFDKGEVAK